MSAVLREHIAAPAGWGHRPGASLTGPVSELPDLPLLQLVGKGGVTATVCTALQTVPDLLPTLTARMVMDKYKLSRSMAHDVLRKVRA